MVDRLREVIHPLQSLAEDQEAASSRFVSKVTDSLAELDAMAPKPSIGPQASARTAPDYDWVQTRQQAGRVAGKLLKQAQPRQAGTVSRETLHDGELKGPMRKLLQALAWWAAMGHPDVSKVQAATKCGWKVTSSNIRDRLSELSSRQLVIYPSPGRVQLTEAGRRAAPAPDMGGSLVESLRAILKGPQLKLFDILSRQRSRSMMKPDLAVAAGWSPDSSNIRDRCSELSSMEIIEYPSPGMVRLQEWVK